MPPQPPAGGPPQPPAYQPGGPQPPSQPPGQPGVYPSQTPQPAYAGGYAATPAYVAPVQRYRTGWVLFAQFIMILKGIFWLLAGAVFIAGGVYLIINGTSKLASLPGYSQYASTISSYLNAIVGVLIGIGVFLLIIGLLGIILGVIVGRPSNGARWTIVVFTVLAGIWWLYVTLIGLGNHNNGSTYGWLFGLVFLVTDLIVLYALLLNGRARHGFAGRPPT